jgi:hypothetical protein
MTLHPVNLERKFNMSSTLHVPATDAPVTIAAIAPAPSFAPRMKTRLKVILAATGAAVLVSIVMAETVMAEIRWNTHVPLSTDHVYRSQMHRHRYGYGAVAYPPAVRRAPAPVINGARPQILDCVHVPFPQCGEGG